MTLSPLCTLVLLPTFLLHGQTPSATVEPAAISLEPQALVDANTLREEGKRPYHLKMSFQVFDLRGENAEAGSLEYWWAGAQGSHLEITSPSLGTVHDLHESDAQSVTARRSLYLVAELLQQFESPAALLGLPRAEILSERRVLSNVAMECMHAAPPPSKYTPDLTDVCVDVATGTVRLIGNAQNEIIRNRPAHLGNTRVALDIMIRWGGKKAISGHVDQLKGFDPGEALIALEKPDAQAEKGAELYQIGVSGAVLAGNKVSGSSPTYPGTALHRRIQGAVLLAAEITKAGQIALLVPLASPDAALTDAAVRAVKDWRYTPYLLNGEPVSVSTTITVNFNLNLM